MTFHRFLFLLSLVGMLLVTTVPDGVVPAPLLAAPTNLVVHNDDHVARLSWQPSSSASAVGYKVTWSGSTTVTYTPYSQVNLQPLADGQTYTASVQAVDDTGALSAAATIGGIQTDPTRVNALRAQMTGLFSDFDTGTVIDPTQWYTTYNNVSQRSAAFLAGDQQHLHFFIENGNGSDRASITMRALHPFDFTDRTGTVAWDFDYGGPSGRYEWYLTLTPNEVDDVNYNTDNGNYPLDFFQVFVASDAVSFRRFVGGQLVQEWAANLDHNGPLRNVNVREPSILHISQNAADLSIAGQTILSATGINLDFQRAWVLNQTFAYDLPKGSTDGFPFALGHWDNIGFDAPATGYAPDVLHNYMDSNIVQSDRQYVGQTDQTTTWTVHVPDDLSGATSARLLLDIRSEAGAPATLTFNGTDLHYQPWSVGDNVAADTRVYDVSGLVHTGDNTVAISHSNCGCGFYVQNVHVEVAFPNGSNAPYTPPAGQQLVENGRVPDLAPHVAWGANAPADGATVHDTVPVEATADGVWTLLPIGHVNAVAHLNVLVDGKSAAHDGLAGPTLRTDQTISLDTTQLANGAHTLQVQVTGASGITDVTSARTIVVANGTPTDTPTATPAPSPTATPTPSPTATPTPTDTPTATPTPSPTDTPTPAPSPTATPTAAPVVIDGVPCTVVINGVPEQGTCTGAFVPGH
jgi:hypothetical protein